MPRKNSSRRGVKENPIDVPLPLEADVVSHSIPTAKFNNNTTKNIAHRLCFNLLKTSMNGSRHEKNMSNQYTAAYLPVARSGKSMAMLISQIAVAIAP